MKIDQTEVKKALTLYRWYKNQRRKGAQVVAQYGTFGDTTEIRRVNAKKVHVWDVPAM